MTVLWLGAFLLSCLLVPACSQIVLAIRAGLVMSASFLAGGRELGTHGTLTGPGRVHEAWT